MGQIRSLHGVDLTFTGILGVKRDVAAKAARKAGAKAHSGPVLAAGKP